MKRLIILRHGYTFESNEEPRRVGCKTDLPLVARGKDKIIKISQYLKTYKIDRIVSSNLKRTIETATIVKNNTDFKGQIIIDNRFNEIDYGPDENKIESEVIKRLGNNILLKWESENILPDGWILDIKNIEKTWIDLANDIELNQTYLVVTSAGIARFSLAILPEKERIDFNNSFKVNPGHICIFESQSDWELKYWNYFLNEND